jgi:hypothetical protein
MALGFELRRRLAWPGLPFPGEAAADAAPTPRGRELEARYRLAPMSRATREEVLGTLDLLDRIPAAALGALPSLRRARALDVGARNWRYAGALSAWLRDRLPGAAAIEVDGVELDAYRLYADLRTRVSYGRHFARACSDARARFTYHAGDIRDWREPADLVTWLFPFVSAGPHRAWGLPPRLFDPEGAFRHVAGAILRPGGRLVVANQGEWEWRETERRLSGARLLHQDAVEGSLHASPYPIVLSVWTRTD